MSDSTGSIYYQDDFVTLYLGDCLTQTAWLDADVLCTDPPYGMAYVSGASRHRGPSEPIHGDSSTAARDAALAAWGEARPALVFGTWRIAHPNGTRAQIVWDKGDSPGMGALDLPWGLSHEEVYVLGKGWPILPNGGRRREGGKPRRDPSIIRCTLLNSQAKDRPEHPTPKPLALMSALLDRCPPGTIADPFAGSGSTLVAAKALGRKAIGVELDEHYCEIAARRLSQDVLDFGGEAS